MKTKLSLIIVVSLMMLGVAYGERIIAQPESREVYNNAGTYVQYESSTGDPNTVYMGYNDTATDKNDGSLVLAFKLPQIPAGQVITSASVHWFYVGRYKYPRVKHDIYVLPYRAAAANPVIVSEEDYYLGTHDTTNAMLLAHNVADYWTLDYSPTINEWRSTDPDSPALALFLQNQCYNSGAQVGDWVYIRFSPQADSGSYYRETIGGPLYSDPDYRPYIEYTVGPREKLAAQPESREVFYYGQVLETSVKNAGDPNLYDTNYNRMTHSDGSTNLWDGALVLAFKLPVLPANKVIAKASLKWFYVDHYKNRGYPIDLYAIPYRTSSTNPLIIAGDHYVDYPSGTKDTTDAVLMAQDIIPVLDYDPDNTGNIYQWVSSEIPGRLLTWFIHSQYQGGAVGDDYILLRFNSTVIANGWTSHVICGPQHSDVNYRPYIEYEIADATEGNWRPITLEPQVSITDAGVLSNPSVSIGCYDTGSGYENVELIVPFQFPSLLAGEYVKEVDLQAVWGGRTVAGNFNTDLYGLPYRSSTAFQSSDFWVGPYAPLAGDVPALNGTPIDGDVFEGFSTSSGQVWVSDPNCALRAACYMNDLKTAGAASSDYGFFRFGMRYDDFLYYVRQSVSGFTMWAKVATEAPVCLNPPATEGDCPRYNNPDRLLADTNWDCVVNLEDMAVMATRWMMCAAVPADPYCN